MDLRICRTDDEASAARAELESLAAAAAERDEAREVARQLQTAANTLLAERDEARALARNLHARGAASGPGADAASSTRAMTPERSISNANSSHRSMILSSIRRLISSFTLMTVSVICIGTACSWPMRAKAKVSLGKQLPP